MYGTINILILEHDENDIGLLLHQLKKDKIDFEYLVVEDEAGFRNAIETYCPDIILSDYSLPTFNGLAAFDIAMKNCPHIPFLIVSGTIGEENAVELIKHGVTDYVVKDKLFALPNKIRRALKEAREKKERIETENNLIKSEKRLAEAESIAHLGSWEVDLLNKKHYWSDEVYRILGIKPGSVKPSPEAFFSFIHPDDLEFVRDQVIESERDFSAFAYTARILLQDNSVTHISATGKFIKNLQGQPIRRIGIVQDITETKNLEANLKAINKELETFIYRASHDLRGPLTSIMGLTAVSKAEITDPLAKKYLTMIEASAQKLDSTLVALVQSMTMRDMVVTSTDINFDDLIREITSQLKFHEGFSKIKINVNNHVSEPFKSNKLILSSVFQNLIQNAIKYQKYNNGESYLNIDITKKEGGLVEIIFEDNGIGIDEFMQDRIFEMYFRGTTSVSGSGLGLYIVKIGIEKLKGKIKLKSAKDKGSRFIITLPEIS
jgi:PAS domain S-box-containing protein